MANKEQLTYAQALAELETIVREIEEESIDVDVLTEKVKRATYLIKFCRGRLKSTEEDVKKVLSEIEGEIPEEPESEEPGTTELEPF